MVVSIAIAVGALFFRNLDLSPNLSYLSVDVLSGSREGQYHSIVERLAGAAAQQQGTIRNIATQGSRENLERLVAAQEDCEVQLGLVQDGFDWSALEDLELIGRVGRAEAFVLLGRNGDNIRRLEDLQGSKIGIGPERSGTAFFAKRLLNTADLVSLEIAFSHHPLKQQIELTAGGELDLALFVIDENADLIREAVREQGLQIVGLEHAKALARRLPYLHYDTLVAGLFDPIRVIPPEEKPILRLDTLLLSNGCAAHSDIVGIMTLLARAEPDFIDRNRGAQAPKGLTLAESARGFYENEGAELTDQYVPWLVDIMPPANWVYTIMAVSLFFNLAGFVNNLRLALIDLNRVALEHKVTVLFGRSVSNEEIRHFEPQISRRKIDLVELDKLIEAYEGHMRTCRRQSLSVFSPMGEEMGYRDQEVLMTLTLDALRELRQRLDGVTENP
jgi:TRAP-type uncharacterized transport system substrate-binding protein